MALKAVAHSEYPTAVLKLQGADSRDLRVLYRTWVLGSVNQTPGSQCAALELLVLYAMGRDDSCFLWADEARDDVDEGLPAVRDGDAI